MTLALADRLQAAAEYEALGFDTLPLLAGTKDPACFDWPRRDPAEMWAEAPTGANVGIRAGGPAGVAVLDCDERTRPGTYANAQNWLFGLGYEPGSYPTVKTASGRLGHIYLALVGVLPGHYRELHTEFGAGEFRYGPGAQWAAPPSIVTGNTYTLAGGDFRQLPRVTVADVLPLLKNKSLEARPERPAIPGRAWQLLQGRGLDNYPSRSEAEQALLVMLANAGHDFATVLRLFQTHPAAGKFAELHAADPDNARRWLGLSFAKAQAWAAQPSAGRRLADALRGWAHSRAWPGRAGLYDQAVYLAHLGIAHRAGREHYGAASRELAELAGVSHVSANAATRRLVAAGLLKVQQAGTVSRPTVYRLVGQDVHKLTTPTPPFVRECKVFAAHDAFRPGGLGKSAAQVWALLQAGPQTVADLATQTGRTPRTVRAALKRMARIVEPVTGEIVLTMVEREGEKWQALPGVDLDHVARVTGTAGKGKAQRARHRQERQSHRQALARGAVGGA